MNAKKVIPFLVISGVVILLPALAVAAGAGTCAELFDSKGKKIPTGATQQYQLKPQSASNAIVVGRYTVPLKEIIEIRDGYSQYPPLDLFGSAYLGDTYSERSPLGEKVRVEFFPDAHPFSDQNKYNKNDNAAYGEIPYSNQQQRSDYDRLGYSNSGRAQNLPAVRDQVPAEASLSDAEKREAARAYALQSFGSGRQIDEATLEYTTKAILASPEMMKEAMKVRVAIKNARSIKLTNFGSDRYFWFKPEGSSSYHAARIIDIHQNNNPSGVVFLVEYVIASPTEGMRIRRIQQLRETEAESLQTTVGEKDRNDAAQEFFDTLSPDEIQTLKLAKELDLKLFGYTDIGRGRSTSFNAPTALREMNSITHLALQKHINDTFGGVDDLLTSQEKQQPYVNYIDVFARLNAEYVMKRFGGAKGLQTEYYWLITEDGQLKVMPSMQRGNNLKPRTLRLAGGRKVFAGGSFFLRPDGSIDLKLDATSYQAMDEKWGETDPFQEGNPSIKDFISIVFGVQAGAKVASIGNVPVESWHTSDSRAGYAAGGDQQKQGQAEDFVFNMKKKAATNASSAPTHGLDWDVESSIPLDLTAFADKTAGGSRYITDETKMKWAHYVLKTQSTMALGDIKKAYRKLITKFHTDKTGSERAAKVVGIINSAKTYLDNELNLLKKKNKQEEEEKKNGQSR